MSAPVFPASWDKLNVVLGHDWLTGMRGGERVLELLGRGFPRAPLVTLLHNPNSVSNASRAFSATIVGFSHSSPARSSACASPRRMCC